MNTYTLSVFRVYVIMCNDAWHTSASGVAYDVLVLDLDLDLTKF